MPTDAPPRPGPHGGLLDLVAAGLLRRDPDTRAARQFRNLLFPAAGGPTAPASLEALAARLGIPAGERAARMAAARAEAARVLADGERAGLDVCGLLDDTYPERLREIPDPPLVMWRRGRWIDRPAVAMVGSRNASAEGLAVARRLARSLSECGITVVSGLARGIDAAAHRGALDGPGSTVAVLGCGANVAYPAANRELAAQIAARGCVLSEFLPGQPPRAWHFPVRNRIISGLSLAVIVVEAAERSGSLITARAALDQGRDVLAVPGSVTSGAYRGCHALIKDGARLVETLEDVLEEIGWRSRPPAVPAPDRSAGDRTVHGVLAGGAPLDLDELARRTALPAGDLLAELGRLELAGVVTRLPGGRFARLD